MSKSTHRHVAINTSNFKKIGEILREYREDYGMFQREMAKKMKKHQSQISAIESPESTGAMGVNTLVKYLDVLGLELTVSPKPLVQKK